LFRTTELAKLRHVAPRLQPSAAFLSTLAVLCALLHAVLAVTASSGKSMTSDEIAHLAAGLAYNTRNDYRFQPENGNLPQRLAAIPLTLAGQSLPPAEDYNWKAANVWRYGHAFFYERGLSTDEFLFLGRAMIALMSAATGLLVFFWSRALFGWRGAFLSLILFTFCPTFLAHGALATSDVVMTFFFLASVGAWWRHLENPGTGGALLSAVTLGLAFVAKFSAVLLPPMLALCALVWAGRAARQQGWRPVLARLVRSTAAHLAITWAIIWLFYGFRFSAFAPDFAVDAAFYHSWSFVLSDIGLPGKIIWHLKEWRILPEAWLYGLAFVLQFSKARGAFMNGDYSLTGWVTFFPFAFLIKTTLPLLCLLVVGLVASTGKFLRVGAAAAWSQLRPLTPLVVLFAVYWATSLISHLNIGHRHILPTYPVLFIAAGWLGRWLDLRRPFAALLVIGLTLGHIGASLRARPDYLAYFNELVGGSKNGSRYLVDSSLDWGQELPGVKTWLDAHARPGEPVFMSYFGTAEPDYYGLQHVKRLPFISVFETPQPLVALEPGLYCISATMLSHVYSDLRGPWTRAWENEFLAARAIEPALIDYTVNHARRAELLKSAPASKWQAVVKRYDVLRFARLCYYLRLRSPEAQIGHAIFIYRLSADEIHAATAGSLADWSNLMKQTADPH
jgi:hypothetical protein